MSLDFVLGSANLALGHQVLAGFWSTHRFTWLHRCSIHIGAASGALRWYSDSLRLLVHGGPKTHGPGGGVPYGTMAAFYAVDEVLIFYSVVPFELHTVIVKAHDLITYRI